MRGLSQSGQEPDGHSGEEDKRQDAQLGPKGRSRVLGSRPIPRVCSPGGRGRGSAGRAGRAGRRQRGPPPGSLLCVLHSAVQTLNAQEQATLEFYFSSEKSDSFLLQNTWKMQECRKGNKLHLSFRHSSDGARHFFPSFSFQSTQKFCWGSRPHGILSLLFSFNSGSERFSWVTPDQALCGRYLL